MHVLSAPAWSLKRAQLFFKVSSFAQRPAQQGMPIMSPVMAKALVDVSAESNQGPSAHSNLRKFGQRSVHLGTGFES